MKPWRSVFVFGMICGAISAAKEDSALPVWSGEKRTGVDKSGWLAGETLLSDEPQPDETAIEERKPLDFPLPSAEEIAETASVEHEIPKEFWAGYFALRPESFLVDPQGLLSPVDYRDRLGFLNYHADDSAIDLFVYVFKGDQEIPGEVREEELVERLFIQGRPAAVIFYHMGRPQRSVLHLSPALNDVVPVAEQKRAMESAVMQALKDEDPARQIEGFLVQMSIRIYWMERMLGGGAVEGEELAGIRRAAGTPVRRPTVIEKLQPLIDEVRHFAIPVAACGVLLVGLVMLAWLKRRKRYQFPEFDVEPRLGGSHAAGVGAVISFVSAAVPPASQRDQVPDYLRRA